MAKRLKASVIKADDTNHNTSGATWFETFENWQNDTNKAKEFTYAVKLMNKWINKEAKAEQKKNMRAAQRLAKSLGMELQEELPNVSDEQLNRLVAAKGMKMVNIDANTSNEFM
jgi:fumarylacetoacetate (FAA) hydrolase family protein